MMNYFKQDNKIVGTLGVLLSEIITLGVMLAGLLLANISIEEHIKWFAIIFVPGLLVVRYYMKQKFLIATKSAIIAFFLTFVIFMTLLIKSHQI